MPQADSTRAEVLVATHLDTLFRAAYRLTRNMADAQDLVQDTCLAAAENIGKLAATDNPLHWLLRVLHNRFLDGARRRSRSPLVAAEAGGAMLQRASEAPGPEQMQELAEAGHALERAFLRLDDTQRTLLSLRAAGHDLAEIESITGIGGDVLRARLHRARRSLARHLEEQAASGGPCRVEGRT